MAAPRRSTNRPRYVRGKAAGELIGFADLYRQLSVNLPAATQSAVLRRSGKAAMQPVMDRIEEAAPERSGQTKASVRLTVRVLKASARFGAAIRFQIGVGSRSVFWPRFAERGTIHEAAKPFIRPVFDSEQGAVLARLSTALQIDIRKSIARRLKKLSGGK